MRAGASLHLSLHLSLTPCSVPYKYGGSKYARNPPVPPQIHAVMDYNRDYPPSEQALAEAASAHAPAAAHH